MEGAGEDPYLGSQIAIARVQGFQGDDFKSNMSILACAKHFAAYAFAESGRDYNTVDISESTLQNVILPPFKAASDAGVRTFMNSFNEISGIPSTGNSYLQRKILKGEWNFNGFVVSDWGSIGEMINHGYAKDNKQASEIAVKAGSDMDMESNAYVENLVNLVSIGTPICLNIADTELLLASTFKGAACVVIVNAAPKANTIQLNTAGF
jgi:beta-glucosidase